MGITATTIHALSKQAKGDFDWHTALNTTLDKIDERLPRGYAGDPNGNVAGAYRGQPVYDYTNKVAYFCTTTGNAASAVWEPAAGEVDKEVKMTWGAVADIPAGWQLCDGSNGTPDLRNKFIVGANADDAGVAKSTITGVALQSGGATSVNTSSAGGFTLTGTVGNTTLTTGQIPSHTHASGTIAVSGGSHNHKMFDANTSSGGISLSGTTNVAVGFPGGANDTYVMKAPNVASTITLGVTSTENIGALSVSGSTASAGTGGAHTHTFTADAVAAHTHSVTIIPPFYALCFITRIPA